MEDVRIDVSPTADGWLMQANGVEPLVFRSGAQAEAGAHRLGKSMASSGADSVVVVHDRSGRVAGSTRYARD